MIRESILAGAILVMVICVPGMVGATNPPPPWYFSVIQDQVPQGAPIMLQVVGPPNGTFSVAVNPLPFNTSQPVFTGLYELPATAELTNGSAIGEVSLNTTLLGIQGYELRLASSNSTVFGTEVVSVTTGVSYVLIDTEIEQLNYGARENASRITSLLWNEGNLQNEYLYAVIAGFSETALLVILMYYTRTSAAEKRLGKKLHRTWEKIGTSGPGYIESLGPFERPVEVPEINPDKYWVANQCNICELPFTKPDLRTHLTGPMHKIPANEADAYMKVSEDARRRIRNALRLEKDDAAKRMPSVHPETGIDFSDLQDG